MLSGVYASMSLIHLHATYRRVHTALKWLMDMEHDMTGSKGCLHTPYVTPRHCS